jgi:hypothetical protein
MTIDEAITVLGMVEAHGICIEAKDIAVDTMRKYQKIEEIVSNYGFDTSWVCLKKIREVLEDGND